MPAQHCATGRVLLGDATRDFVYQRFATTRFRSESPSQLITSVRDFWTEIERARQQGYATEVEELEAGLVGAAAPIRNDRGRIVAAICTSAPKDRRENELEVLAEAVVRTANDVSLALGWQPAE